MMSDEKEQRCFCRCCEGYESISIFDMSSIDCIDRKFANQYGFRYVESDKKKFIIGWSLRFRRLLDRLNISRKRESEFYVMSIGETCTCFSGCAHEVWRKQKQESRDKDERALASGEKTCEDLRISSRS